MKIELKKAWKVQNDTITEGLGLKLKTFQDGFIERNNTALFTLNGEKYIKEDWDIDICFDLQSANKILQNQKNDSIKYAKERIKYYTDKLNALENK